MLGNKDSCKFCIANKTGGKVAQFCMRSLFQ